MAMGRPKGSKNKFKKPEFVAQYERYKRRYKLDPVEALFQFAAGRTADGVAIPECTLDLQYKATKDLVATRFAAATVAKYDEAVLQQDMFDVGTDQRIVFGVANDRAA